MKKISIRLSVVLFLSGFFFSCEEKIRSSIPDCEVYIETQYDEYVKLKTYGNWVSYFRQPGVQAPAKFRYGYGGVLIYRDLNGNVRSCDLACPVEALPTVRVEINMLSAVCPECGSKFDLSWGLAAPVSGPAKESLYNYSQVFERATTIVVSN